MRKKAKIQALSERARMLTFPKIDYEIGRFKSALRDLVTENFGYSAGKDLKYDDETQTFFWDEEEGCGFFKDKGGRVLIRRTYSIDPTQPLRDEFQRIENERAELKERASLIRNTVLKNEGEL